LLIHLLSLLFSHSGVPRVLHSFPTRRSSDLGRILRCRVESRPPPRACSSGEPGICPGGQSARRGSGRHPDFHERRRRQAGRRVVDRKSTRLNSSHVSISYAVFCLKKKKTKNK